MRTVTPEELGFRRKSAEYFRRKIITDVLGRTKPITRSWPSGEYECPFCHYPVESGKAGCQNPACSANVVNTGPEFKRLIGEQEARSKARRNEEADRKRNNEISADYNRQRRKEEAARTEMLLLEAREKGFCEKCLLHSLRTGGKVKKVRHRGGVHR